MEIRSAYRYKKLSFIKLYLNDFEYIEQLSKDYNCTVKYKDDIYIYNNIEEIIKHKGMKIKKIDIEVSLQEKSYRDVKLQVSHGKINMSFNSDDAICSQIYDKLIIYFEAKTVNWIEFFTSYYYSLFCLFAFGLSIYFKTNYLTCILSLLFLPPWVALYILIISPKIYFERKHLIKDKIKQNWFKIILSIGGYIMGIISTLAIQYLNKP